MTRLFLVRHGETIDLETKKVYKGILDIPLSQAGAMTMKRTAVYLERFPISHVYTSALSRSIESGRFIAEPRGLPMEITADLNEVHFGLWQGLSFEEVKEAYPREFRLWWEDPMANPPPGAESLEVTRERVLRQFNAIARRHEGEEVVLATHGGTMRIIVCSILGTAMSGMFSIQQDNGCVNVIDVYDDGIAVVSLLNYTPSGPFGSTLGLDRRPA